VHRAVRFAVAGPHADRSLASPPALRWSMTIDPSRSAMARCPPLSLENPVSALTVSDKRRPPTCGVCAAQWSILTICDKPTIVTVGKRGSTVDN
jgi:hypothetical protein